MRNKTISIWRKTLYLASIILTFVSGILLMAVPFLPFGWFLIAASLLLLMPYFKFFRKWVDKINEKDSSGKIKKLKRKITKFYDWCHELDCD